MAGSSGSGTVFRINTRGKEKVLHSFGLSGDGANPVANLTDADGYPLRNDTAWWGRLRNSLQREYDRHRESGPRVWRWSLWQRLWRVPRCRLDQRQRYAVRNDGVRRKPWVELPSASRRAARSRAYITFTVDAYPEAPLLDVQGLLYGTTASGGSFGKGMIFEMSLTGREKGVRSFRNGFSGATPLAGLIDVNGTLYGTTSAGGTYGEGTVFAVTP